MNAAWVVWTIIAGGDTQTLLAGKKIELYALSGSGDTKDLWFSQIPLGASTSAIAID